MVDPALEGNFDLDELYALCDIARTCVQVLATSNSQHYTKYSALNTLFTMHTLNTLSQFSPRVSMFTVLCSCITVVLRAWDK